MKYFYKTVLVFFVFSILLVSCKKTVTEPEENTLIGKWSFSSLESKRFVTTNSNQTAKLPFTGIGTIKIQGITATRLNALAIVSFDPLIIGVYTIEFENYVSTSFQIDDENQFGTVYFGPSGKTYTGIVNYTFDGNELIVTETTLTNKDDASDTVTLSGAISFETLNIEANTTTTINVPAFQTQLPSRYMTIDFLEDGTFSITINNNDGSVTDFGVWETSGNDLTLTVTTDDTNVDLFEYSLNNTFLELKQQLNACSSSQDYLQCLNYFEGLYQIDYQSIIEMLIENTINFRRLNEL